MKTSYQNKIGVIVLGGHVQGYGIVRIFGEEGIPTVVIDNTKNNIARHSKFCTKFYLSDYDNLLKLLDEFKTKNIFRDWLIFPTDDYYVRLLSKNKDDLARYFKITVDKWKIVNTFFDKTNSYPLAEKVGVPIPITFYPESEEDLEQIEIEYPCIIKPAIMKDFYLKFKKKVFVCNTKAELIEKFRKVVRFINPHEIIVQEIIPGNSYNQYSVGIFFDKNKTYNYLVARRAHQHPIDFGNATTYAETVDLQILIEYAEKILQEANFWGLCEVEFKFDERDGKYKFLEVNPRTWKWHLISKIAGVPFLKSMFNYLIDDKPIIAKKYQNAAWRDLSTDLIISTLLKIKGLYKRKSRYKKIEAVLNIRDLKPFLWQIIYIPYNFLKR